jgi:hypothetical protein
VPQSLEELIGAKNKRTHMNTSSLAKGLYL